MKKAEFIKLQGFKKIEELADSAVCDRGNVWTSLTLKGNEVYLTVMCSTGKDIVNTFLEDLRIIEDMFKFNNGKICKAIDTVLYPLGTTELNLSSADLIYDACEDGFVFDSMLTCPYATDRVSEVEYFLTYNEGARLTAKEDGRFLLTCK